MSLRDLITHYSQSQPATQEDDEDVLKVVHSQLQQTQDNTQPARSVFEMEFVTIFIF